MGCTLPPGGAWSQGHARRPPGSNPNRPSTLFLLNPNPSATHRAACRLTFPAHGPSGQPLDSVDLLLVCDSYLGLDQQYSIPLRPGSAGAGGALPPLGQAARRARRAEQQEARRQHATAEAAGLGQQQQVQQQAAAPMDVDHQQRGQQGKQRASAGGAAGGEALPQRGPRQPRGGRAGQQLAHAEATLDCRLEGASG